MPLDDIEKRMEEIDETPDNRKKEENEENTGAPSGGIVSRIGSGRTGKIAKWALLAMLAGILAYFLLKPHGGRGAGIAEAPKTHALGVQTVNLRGGRTAVRIDVVVEANTAHSVRHVSLNESLLRDKVIDILSQKTVDDLDGVAKRNKLKRELLDDFNLELDIENGRLMRIYFREFFYCDLKTQVN